MQNRTLKVFISSLFILILCLPLVSLAQQAVQSGDQNSKQIPNDEKLVVLWTSGDREVALKMVFMYTLNSPRFGWWEDITLLVWGPSAKLLSEDVELQDSVKKMKEAGIQLKACKACADQYGVSEKLEALGVEVKYMGKELTDYLKEGRHVITL